MARITAEDCIVKVPNRFELVMYAAQRARGISAGAALTVDRDNDKNPVVALREIAESTVPVDELETSLIKSLQKHVEMDEPEEDEMDILAIQQELMGETGTAPKAAASLDDDEGDEDTGDDAGDGADAEEPEEDVDIPGDEVNSEEA